MKLLIEAGALVNQVCEHGETPLHVAAAWNQAEVAYVLLRFGADASAKTVKGDTPLDFALRWEFKEVEKVICSVGNPLPSFALIESEIQENAFS